MIRMLVLEDDAVAAESSCRMLQHAGIDCSFERVESEAEFRQALGRSPDVILSDSDVPGFDGLSALAIVQAESPGTPFIFVTGEPDASAAQLATARGAAGFLAKEDLERLAGVVCSALMSARTRCPSPIPIAATASRRRMPKRAAPPHTSSSDRRFSIAP